MKFIVVVTKISISPFLCRRGIVYFQFALKFRKDWELQEKCFIMLGHIDEHITIFSN